MPYVQGFCNNDMFGFDDGTAIYEHTSSHSSSGYVTNECINIDVGLQQENLLLKSEIVQLRAEIERLTAENSMLRMHKCTEMNKHDVIKIANEASGCVTKFSHFWKMLLSEDGRVKHKSLKFDYTILSRMDMLYRLRVRSPNNHPLIKGYFPDPVDQTIITEYFRTHDYQLFLADCYYGVLHDIPTNVLLERAVELCSMLHLSGFSVKALDSNILRQLASRKYDHELESYVYPYKLDIDDTFEPADDHIYHSHSLDPAELSLLHLMSHLSSNVTGQRLARYHVGSSCRMTESAVLELAVGDETRYFKPLKCSGPYAIFEHLPGEKDYRVNGLLHHFGLVPITLVRDIVVMNPAYDEYFISGPIGPAVTCLMKRYSVNKIEILFGEKGLYIKPSCMKTTPKIIDCCKNAFAINNDKTRTHKPILTTKTL